MTLCRSCARPLPADSGARVYCSKRCRVRRVHPEDRRLEQALLELLDARAADATICPSEVARRVGGEEWREWMERVRRAGRRLAANGRVEFTQRGRVVDPATARGPVRIRRARESR